MSLRTALQAFGILVVGSVLLWGLLAMGPPGWVVFGTMLLIGTIQVYRNRRSEANGEDRVPKYCANCGSPIDVEMFDAGDPDRSNWSVRYCPDCGAPIVPPSLNNSSPAVVNCPNCGAPIVPPSRNNSSPAVVNCPNCGAPNDPTDSECTYCQAGL